MKKLILDLIIMALFLAFIYFCAYAAGWRAKEEKDNGLLDREKRSKDNEL